MTGGRVGAKRARILVVSSFWPDGAGGSQGNFVYDQTRALLHAGHDVTVIVLRPWSIHKAQPKGYRDLPGADIHVARFFLPPSRYPFAHIGFRLSELAAGRAIRKAVAGLPDRVFDALHIHDAMPSGVSLHRWADTLRVNRKVMTVHGLGEVLAIGRSHPGTRASLARLWSELDYVVAVGRPLITHLGACGVEDSKLVVIPNGASLPRRWTSAQGQRQEGARRTVLSVSNLIPLKGIDYNLRALANVSLTVPELEWAYRIIGAGPELTALKTLAARLKLDDRVTFLGRLGHDETMTEMELCDVFSMPSWGDAFGIVYLEAMARGRPVIGCRRSGAQESVRDGVDGLLVEPKDVASLSDALQRLLLDPQLCQQMGEAGRARALEFTWAANANAYRRLYV